VSPAELIGLLGYQVEVLDLVDCGVQPHVLKPEGLARLRAEIDARRPVLVWHAFTMMEYDVVVGYDEAGLYGRGSYAGLQEYASAAVTHPATADPVIESYIIGARVAALDASSAERAALAEAVRHARDQANADKLGGSDWVFLEGLQAYDRWVRDWASPQRKRGLGDSYCLGIYRSTHRAGAAFLREIAPRYPGAAPSLLAAAEQMAAEADALDACVPLLGWESPEGPDAERNASAAALLSQARDAYARAIDALAAALPAL